MRIALPFELRRQTVQGLVSVLYPLDPLDSGQQVLKVSGLDVLQPKRVDGPTPLGGDSKLSLHVGASVRVGREEQDKC
jgi:hypothetical protein